MNPEPIQWGATRSQPLGAPAAPVTGQLPAYQPPTAAPRRRSRGLVVAVIALAVTCAALASYVGYTFVKPAPASQSTASFVTPTTAAATPAAAPSPPPPAALPTSFNSARQLVDALNANGLPCGPADVVANPSLAETLIDCGPEIVVGTYASHRNAEDAFTVLVTMLAGTNSPVHMAIGSNWTVSADAAYAKRAAVLFGGVYHTT